MIPTENLQRLRGMAANMFSQAPVSSEILKILADDIEKRGPINQLIAYHPESAAPLFCLRVLAGVRLLILTGKAPDLAARMKSRATSLGNLDSARHIRELLHQALVRHPDEIRAAMDRPLQLHRPGRARYLLRGLGMIAAPKIRLLEVGACAGLNLILDRYHWFGNGWEWGDTSSTVRLTADGPKPCQFSIVDRAGCDLTPRNPADPDDAMILQSFIPYEHKLEQSELAQALSLASPLSVRIDKENAVGWLMRELSKPVDPGVYTVVWHSLLQEHLSPEEKSQIEYILSVTARRIKLARICYEPNVVFGVPRLKVDFYS
ncbi:DUF2332 family protein [Streptomyces sp. NPDC002547]